MTIKERIAFLNALSTTIDELEQTRDWYRITDDETGEERIPRPDDSQHSYNMYNAYNLIIEKLEKLATTC